MNFDELFFIVFVPINIIMQHEKATVKKAVKKYTTKSGDERESISVNINLGAKSGFENGDNVAVISIADFNELSNITADEIDDLKKDSADKDEIIAANNERIDKLNRELQNKFNKINEVTAKLKASEKTIDFLESDISAKDETIASLNDKINAADEFKSGSEKTIADNEITINDLRNQIQNLEKTVADRDATIDDYSAKIDKLNESLAESKAALLSNDETIAKLDKEIAVLNAIDISELKEKAKELDIVKDDLIAANDKLNSKSNFVSLLQNQIMEYIQLVNYYKEKATASENKGLLDYILNRDVTANIDEPTLYLIDLSGSVRDRDDNIVEIDKAIDKPDDPDDDSGDNITLI